MATKELREKRANLVQQAREIQDRAREDGREVMNQEEEARFDALMSDVEQLGEQVRRMEALEDAEKELAETVGRKTEESRSRTQERQERRTLDIGHAERGDALRAWFMQGSNDPVPETLAETARKAGVDLDHKLLSFNLANRSLRSLDPSEVREWEQRALTLTTTAGGYTVPDDLMRSLEVALLRFGGMRRVADVMRTSTGADLPWPTTNDTTNEGEILGINTEVNQQDIVFGQLVLNAYKYSSKMILVPVELLQDSAVNIAEHIGTALGTRIGRITNKHFTVGTGTNQPRGIVTAAAEGKVGASGQTTSVIYDDLVDLEHSVDPDYRLNAQWMFADSTLKALKKIKVPQFSGDTAGVPLWQPGIAMREPDTILGYSYVINQQVPAMAASAKSIVFGDLSKYKIRDVQDVILRRLDERFADFHQVAFLAFSRHDGDLLDAGTNPVKYYQNAAS